MSLMFQVLSPCGYLPFVDLNMGHQHRFILPPGLLLRSLSPPFYGTVSYLYHSVDNYMRSHLMRGFEAALSIASPNPEALRYLSLQVLPIELVNIHSYPTYKATRFMSYF